MGVPIRPLATWSISRCARAASARLPFDADVMLAVQLWQVHWVFFEIVLYEVRLLPAGDFVDVPEAVREVVAFYDRHVGMFAVVPDDVDGAHVGKAFSV